MKYAGIIYDDFAGAPGVSLSFFTQGCHMRCKGCHNPETWDFDGGREFTDDTLLAILEGLTANNIQRSLCIMGGEPLCKENKDVTWKIIETVRDLLPNVKIYIWTGMKYESLKNFGDTIINNILENADILIDGPYIEELRDVTLKMRGSSNQRIIDLHTGELIE